MEFLEIIPYLKDYGPLVLFAVVIYRLFKARVKAKIEIEFPPDKE